MFSVGQRVWHRGGHRSGTVLACDGGRVYITQDNGAELDFPASELSATPPAVDASGGATRDFARNDVAPSGGARAGARVLTNRVLTARDVTPDIRKGGVTGGCSRDRARKLVHCEGAMRATASWNVAIRVAIGKLGSG
jgi:hypothetical protein